MIINSSAQYIYTALNNRTSSSQVKSTDTRSDKSSEEKIYADPQIEKDRRTQMKNEYYAKVVEEDKKFANPRQHIHDKYKNKHSPYYIEGLTDEERIAAYMNESNYLKRGANSSTNHNDPLFRGMIPLYGNVEYVQKKAFLRQETNNQFGQLLKDNNITIPQDTKLRFTIDPYSYQLNVSGTEDVKLSKSIEDLLNSDENSKKLYYHIMATDLDDNTQFSTEKMDKRSLFYEIKDKTGYDLRDLSVVDGKFLTEDGTDVFEIYIKSIEDGTSVPEEFKGVAIGYHGELLSNLAKKGFDGVPDLILSIDYENDSFYDVGQSKNFGKGQTAWIEELQASMVRAHNATQNTKGYSKEDYENYADKINNIITDAFKNKLEDKHLVAIHNEYDVFDKVELLLKYLFGIEEELGAKDLNNIIEKISKNELLTSENFRTKKTDMVDTYA